MSSGQEVGTIFGEGVGPATAILRSPTVIIATIALWGMNVCLFRIFGIDYVHVLMLDLKKEEAQNKRKRRKSSDSAAETNNKEEKEIELTPFLNEKPFNTSASDDEDSDGVSRSDESFVEKMPKRQHYEITEVKLLSLSALLMITLYTTSYVWIQMFHGSTIGAIFCFYFMVMVGAILPLSSTAWIRLAFKTVLVRAGEILKPRCSCVHGKPKPVPFIDVFFADAMCSMSKVFFDWGMLWLMAAYYPYPVPPTGGSIIVPSCFASVPYLVRARQCLIMYNVGKKKNDPNKHHHVLNAIKYSTSLFPLIVSAYQKTITGDIFAKQLDYLLIVLLAINAAYSLIWDVVMDWGMMSNPSAVVHHAVGPCATGIFQSSSPDGVHKNRNCLDITLRPRLRFGAALTLVVVILDTFLRFSWTLRFYENILFSSKDAYILCTEFLEVFRRSVWNLLRVEWELIKQSQDANSKKTRSSEMKTSDINAIYSDESVESIKPMQVSTLTSRERR